jgi:hypothetical protein
VAFEAAARQQDVDAACGLLTEDAAHEVAKSSSSCAEGLSDLELPDSGSWTNTEVYGQEARLRFQHDTVFVTKTPAGWRVAAAGCQEEQDGSFDCLVQGG